MQVVSSKELQEKALQVETLKQQCPKHEGVYMWRSVNPCTRNTLTYCPECVQETINQNASEQLAIAEAQIRDTRSYSIFMKESIIPSDLKGATVGNFEIHTDQDAEAVNFAKRVTADYVKERYKDSKWEQRSVVKFLQGVDFLILDDLGKESSVGNEIRQGNNWMQKVLYQILENRTNTIITTNFEGKHLKELYEQSLVDRITKGNMKTNAFKFSKDTASRRSLSASDY